MPSEDTTDNNMKENLTKWALHRLCVGFAALFISVSGLHAQNFSLSTNMLDYADFATLNLEASYGVARHWTINAQVKYNPFSFGRDEDEIRRRQRSASAGARYWPWHVFSGWWLSADLKYQEYNVGGLVSVETSEGDRFGVSIGGGYTYMISPHLNLDFGVGVWSGYDSYKVYSCQTCGRIIDRGNKFFVLQSEIILALSYIF